MLNFGSNKLAIDEPNSSTKPDIVTVTVVYSTSCDPN